MSAGRIVLFLLAAVAAAGVGIGIAELQLRHSTSQQEQSAERPASLAQSRELIDGPENVSAGTGRMWVTSDRVDLRSCPSSSCGLSSRLHFREAADVVEVDAGWGRVSRYIDGLCDNGSTSNLAGNGACTPENGFIDGRYAQWAELAYLSPTRPPDPGAGATGLSRLVAQSDDFRLHEAMFVKSAQKLIERGTCTEADFVELGGWVSSPDKPSTYFTYCGGISKRNRYYLNVSTGRIFQ